MFPSSDNELRSKCSRVRASNFACSTRSTCSENDTADPAGELGDRGTSSGMLSTLGDLDLERERDRERERPRLRGEGVADTSKRLAGAGGTSAPAPAPLPNML